MRTDQRLAIVEEVPVSFFTAPYLLFEFSPLRDIHRVNDHPLNFILLIQHGIYFTEMMLGFSLRIHALFLPLHHLPRIQYVLKYQTTVPGDLSRPAQTCMETEFLIRLPDHPSPQFGIGDGAGVYK